MAHPPSQFRRAVLGLHHHAGKLGLLAAIDVARLLDLDLFGLFVEEESLFRLAGLQFVREFSPLGGGWRPIEGEQLGRDLRASARSAERLFTEAIKGGSGSCEFSVVRGSMAEAISAHTRLGDIVMLSAPDTVGDYSAGQFSLVLETALRAAAAVLIVPRRIARRTGDVVAIAAGQDDPSVRIAAGVARAAKEQLVIVELFEGDDGNAGARANEGRGVRRAGSSIAASDPSILVAAFRSERERLIVVTHASSDTALPSMLVSWRRVPVLVIAPDRRDGDEQGH